MSDEPRGVEEGARLLRQRLEIGEGELFLKGMTREQALQLAAAARSASQTRPATAGSATPSPATPTSATPVIDKRRSYAARDGAGGSAGAPAARIATSALPDDYDALRELALGCTACSLAESRTQVVFSDGSPAARLVVVGEAPGAHEDQTGLPFVGAAGKYLDLLLATVGLSREDSVYICNVLKCRPPGNRNPAPTEITACSPFLRKQIELVRPEALLAVGSFAAQLLTGREKTALGKLRGTVYAYEGVPLVVTYHPAALLRNPNWTRPFWDDLQLLRSVMDGS